MHENPICLWLALENTTRCTVEVNCLRVTSTTSNDIEWDFIVFSFCEMKQLWKKQPPNKKCLSTILRVRYDTGFWLDAMLNTNTKMYPSKCFMFVCHT